MNILRSVLFATVLVLYVALCLAFNIPLLVLYLLFVLALLWVTELSAKKKFRRFEEQLKEDEDNRA